MKEISKYFGPVKALDGVSFTVGNAEIHGLLGENGAGKSTLMNILGGALQPSEGQIFIDGQLIEEMTIHKSNKLGIKFIHQELNLVNDLTVFENLFLGQEITYRTGMLDRKAMIARSNDVLKRIKVDINPLETVSNLEPSRKQLVEIARALLFDSKLIIMDEPTTALTNKEIDILFDIIRSLKAHGLSIIFISHKMPELFAIGEKYTVLRDGKFIDSGYFKDIDEQKATNLLVGRSIVDNQQVKEEVNGPVVMQVSGLTSKGHFRDISFDLHEGEVLAITGLHGDGRGELSEALFGARHVDTGTVTVHGKRLNLGNIRAVMKAGVGMVPRNRKERSIIKDLSILNNLSIAFFIAKHNKIFINKKEEIERFKRNQKITDIRAGDMNDYITSMSGGNQQKVIVSRWLELNSDIYIMDNPTQGIDVGAKFEIYKLIGELAQRGKSLIVFSSEFPEIYKISDRCLVMYEGHINAELDRKQLTEMNVMYYATGANKEGFNGKNITKPD
ncbi:MAG: sugar ABC transporter ATP-binding protein [Anaerolineaceae bacterium]|nr:sugar ABC transporter ATP-binding protein [Anaerolineaceae bacterium]